MFRRTVLFTGYCLVVAVSNWQPLRALYEHSRKDETASHIVLIPLITCWLLVLRRRVIFASVYTWWRGGLGVMLVAAGLLVATMPYRLTLDRDSSLSMVVGPLVVLWIGGFLLFYGRTAARAAVFPLLFLGLMVPAPVVILNTANDFLKGGSTEVVAALFAASGTPYYREGFLFKLPFIAIEVGDACSGIRSTIGLLIATLLAGHMVLRTSWKKALLVLVIIPITIFKNGLRIVVLSLLAIHVDRSFLFGQLHHDGGIVFFLLALAMIAPLLLLLHKSERGRRGGLGRAPDARTIPSASPSNSPAG